MDSYASRRSRRSKKPVDILGTGAAGNHFSKVHFSDFIWKIYSGTDF